MYGTAYAQSGKDRPLQVVVKSDVRQVCVLSPLLFIVYMDRITQEANPDPETLNELLFADAQCLIHHNIQGLQDHTDRLHAACQKYGISISIANFRPPIHDQFYCQ